MTEHTPHLLVVDDTPKNIQFLGAVLRDEGYIVSVALNGKEAVERARSIHPDLILMDVMMPEMDGIEACRILVDDPDTTGIPIVFLSAKGSPEDVVEGLSAGGVDYIRKPFQAVEVLQRIASHLRVSELQRELALRVAEAEAAREDALRVSREYASFTRHELSNALGPVLGYSDMLLRQRDLPEETREKWTAQIKDSAVAMKRLLAAIKDLQQIEDGSARVERKPCNLVALLRAEAAGLELSFNGRGRFTTLFPDHPVLIQADQTLLAGVFRNLLKNALEHVVDLPMGEQRLLISLDESEHDVVVAVENGGPAIPASRLETFFEKFNTTKRRSGGTGLGTSYARIVTQAHGGHIQVSSEQGTGTRVIVTLPMSSQQVGSAP